MKTKAFTLIELLIVISIIGIITGITLPVLRIVREKNRTVMCSANLNHLNLALTAYEQSNNTFPFGFNYMFKGPLPPGGYVGDASRDTMGWWWFHFLEKIIGENRRNKSVLWCPARTVQDRFSKPNILCGNYGINQAICKNAPSFRGDFIGRPLNISSIKKPAQTILAMDSGYTLISWQAASESAYINFGNSFRINSFYVPGMEINKKRAIKSGSEIDAIYGRHQYKNVNIAYADGHLSFTESDDLFVDDANLAPFWFP